MALVVVRVLDARPERSGNGSALAREPESTSFIDAQHDRVLGRTQIQPDDVLDLRCKLGVAADFVRTRQVRFQPVGAEYIRHATAGEPHPSREEPCRPSATPAGGGDIALYDLLDRAAATA